MKRFPKTLYVTVTEYDDIDEEKEFYVDTDLQVLADRNEEGTEVAVYQLVKTGELKVTRKVVFE